jgi:predicted ArsR family transcriptional regulator
LESLRAEQAIRSYFKSEGLGRPSKVYEITDSGRELFPRKYDLLLSLILQSLEATEGHEYAKKIIRSIADNMAQGIQNKIKNTSANLEESLIILNSASMSSFYKEEDDNVHSIISHNCIIVLLLLLHRIIIIALCIKLRLAIKMLFVMDFTAE